MAKDRSGVELTTATPRTASREANAPSAACDGARIATQPSTRFGGPSTAVETRRKSRTLLAVPPLAGATRLALAGGVAGGVCVAEASSMPPYLAWALHVQTWARVVVPSAPV